MSIVDICAQVRASAGVMKDLSKLVAKLSGLLVKVRPGGSISDERGGKEVLAPEGKGGRIARDSVNALHRVALEHENRVVENRGSADGRCELGVCLLLGRDVVCLEVDGEAGVDEPIFLAWRSVEGDAGPSGEIDVASSSSCLGERTDIMEGLSIYRIDHVHAFLDNVE